MNKLPLETRVQILTMLVEGSSMRSISRVCDVSINTVTKLLVDAGKVGCGLSRWRGAQCHFPAHSVRRNLKLLLRQSQECARREKRAGGRGRRVDVDRH